MRFRPSSFARDFLGTLAASGVGVISMVLITRLLAAHLGPEGFGAYSTARRVLTAIEPATTMAISITLTRYLAMAASDQQRTAYLRAALLLVLVPMIAVVAAGLWFSEALAGYLFSGARNYESLWVATIVLICGNSFYLTLYAWYRGTSQVRLCNYWQIAIVGIGPLIVVVVAAPEGSAALVIACMALLMLVSLVPLLAASQQESLPWSWDRIRAEIYQLCSYGLPRVPGSVAFGGMLAVGPILASGTGNMETAGYLVVGQSLLRLVEAGTDSFSRAAFPRVAQAFSAGGTGELRATVERIVFFTLDAGFFVTVQLVAVSSWLMAIWLGPNYVAGTPVVRITLLALVPYLLYVMLRSILDAINPRAVTTAYLLVSFVVVLAASSLLWGSGFGSVSWAVGTTAGFVTLGVLTLRRVLADFSISWSKVLRIPEIAISMVLGLPWLLFSRYTAASEFTWLESLLGASVIGLSIVAVYAVFLLKRKPEWLIALHAQLQGSRVN